MQLGNDFENAYVGVRHSLSKIVTFYKQQKNFFVSSTEPLYAGRSKKESSCVKEESRIQDFTASSKGPPLSGTRILAPFKELHCLNTVFPNCSHPVEKFPQMNGSHI